jgi:hypothetical protein
MPGKSLMSRPLWYAATKQEATMSAAKMMISRTSRAVCAGSLCAESRPE